MTLGNSPTGQLVFWTGAERGLAGNEKRLASRSRGGLVKEKERKRKKKKKKKKKKEKKKKEREKVSFVDRNDRNGK